MPWRNKDQSINQSISLSLSPIIIYKARRIGQPQYLTELFETRERIDLGRGDAIPELRLPSWSSEAGKKSLVYECAKF